jgi:hypothetical protein
LDEPYLAKLLESLTEVLVTLDEEDDEDGPTQEEIDAELSAVPSGPCDITQLRMGLQMPSHVPILNEPEFEIEELKEEN